MYARVWDVMKCHDRCMIGFGMTCHVVCLDVCQCVCVCVCLRCIVKCAFNKIKTSNIMSGSRPTSLVVLGA